MSDMKVTMITGSDTILKDKTINNFKSSLRGEMLLAGDDGYEDARKIWNGMFDKKPAIIVRCVGTSDIIKAVNLARDNKLLVAVKGGGHNVAGNAVCDGGIVIDLSLMKSVHVDLKSKTARVEPGCLLSDADQETQIFGMAISGGIVSHTGVAGLTLGGGFGWISRKHGLSIDNLISADVVTADGKLITASKTENSDLFWGLRGGGGNFGIVSSFEFNLAEIGTEVYSGMIIKHFEDAKEYIRFHRDYVRTLPDELTVWMVIRHAPPLPFLDESVHGSLVVAVPFVYLGNESDGERLIKPIREFGQNHGEHIGMTPWVAWQSVFDGLVEHGARNYWKSHHIKGLEDGCIDNILKYAENMPSPDCEIFIPHMEGSPSCVPSTESAYAYRESPFVLNIHTRWNKASDDELCLTWAREIWESTKPYSHGVYVNFISDEGEERVKDAYTKEAWERLVQLKNKYDPTNLFRLNQNIKPNGLK
jgi:FAD/FMN-containing dehydrogenase